MTESSIDTYKKDVDEISNQELAHDWSSLRESINTYVLGTNIVRTNAFLRAVPLCQTQQMESNLLVDTCPLRKSKKADFKQVVPSYAGPKNAYTLLWDMPGNTGYINVVAVMQKFFDQAISGNWSYNPEHYEDAEVPVSVMAQDLLTTYKYGWKTSYYQNTNDMKTDEVEEDKPDLQSLIGELSNANEESVNPVPSKVKGMTVFPLRLIPKSNQCFLVDH